MPVGMLSQLSSLSFLSKRREGTLLHVAGTFSPQVHIELAIGSCGHARWVLTLPRGGALLWSPGQNVYGLPSRFVERAGVLNLRVDVRWPDRKSP